MVNKHKTLLVMLAFFMRIYPAVSASLDNDLIEIMNLTGTMSNLESFLVLQTIDKSDNSNFKSDLKQRALTHKQLLNSLKTIEDKWHNYKKNVAGKIVNNYGDSLGTYSDTFFYDSVYPLSVSRLQELRNKKSFLDAFDITGADSKQYTTFNKEWKNEFFNFFDLSASRDGYINKLNSANGILTIVNTGDSGINAFFSSNLGLPAQSILLHLKPKNIYGESRMTNLTKTSFGAPPFPGNLLTLEIDTILNGINALDPDEADAMDKLEDYQQNLLHWATKKKEAIEKRYAAMRRFGMVIYKFEVDKCNGLYRSNDDLCNELFNVSGPQ